CCYECSSRTSTCWRIAFHSRVLVRDTYGRFVPLSYLLRLVHNFSSSY
ncbi:hypothetical protein WUBG_14207, partial [Wuchereria bancrofti]